MAGDWIKVEHTLPTKPEVSRIADIVGISEDEVVGKLVKLWIWADQHSADGHAVSVTQFTLDRRAECQGLADALRQVGWLEGRDAALSFPNFDRHNGQSAKKRTLALQRKKNERNRPPKSGDEDENLSRTERDKSVTRDREEKSIDREKSAARSIEEIETEASRYPQLPKPDKSFCAWFWDEQEKRGWVDPQTGNPWRDWRAAFRAAWRGAVHNKQERDSRRGAPSPQLPPKPTRAQL